MTSLSDTRVFNRPGVATHGWYWLARSAEIRRGRVKALHLLGRDLAVYRGEDGKVVALDAYCAHMGAHLAEGKVEGNALRCFFHHWRYRADGRCDHIPCLGGAPAERIFTIPEMNMNRPAPITPPPPSSGYSHHGHSHGPGTGHHSH